MPMMNTNMNTRERMMNSNDEVVKQMQGMSKRLDSLEQSVEDLKQLMVKMFPNAYAEYMKEKEHEESSKE